MDAKSAEKELAVSGSFLCWYGSWGWWDEAGFISSGQEWDLVLKVQDQLQQWARDLQERECGVPRCKLYFLSLLCIIPDLISMSSSNLDQRNQLSMKMRAGHRRLRRGSFRRRRRKRIRRGEQRQESQYSMWTLLRMNSGRGGRGCWVISRERFPRSHELWQCCNAYKNPQRHAHDIVGKTTLSASSSSLPSQMNPQLAHPLLLVPALPAVSFPFALP